MWRGPGQDPGGPGASSSDPPNQELKDLKDQFEQQQTLIAQLKEMLRKTEQTSVTQEKVEEYANTLSKMNARAKKSKLKKEQQGISTTPDTKRTTVDTPATEKMTLLRKQLEENKAKLVERGKSQKGLEEMVTQLKAQLDDSQQLINQTPLNLTLIDTKTEPYSINSNSQELYSILVNKEKRISELTSKVQKLEANMMDLQENVKEKDSVIDARTKAITLMSENLSKKGKHTLDQLDDTKEQMRKMQETFVIYESQMKEKNSRLLAEVEERNNQIEALESINEELQNSRSELLVKNSELEERLTNKNAIIEEYKKGSGGSITDTEKCLEIERLNKRVSELEGINASLKRPSESPRNSPQRSSKRGKKGQKKSEGIPLETDNEKRIMELETQLNSERTLKEEYSSKILSLENNLAQQEFDNRLVVEEHVSKISDLESKIEELNTQISAKDTNFDFDKENEEISKLKKQLDESNKSMIKSKAQHKAKIKELTKKIEVFKKISDTNAEIVKLESENTKMNHKIIELEEEKGNLQLKLMASDSNSASAEQLNELERKLEEQTSILASKTELISSLECQIEDFKNKIVSLSDRLETLSELNNDQVKSEMTSIHFEEQLDKLGQEKEVIAEENERLLEKMENLKKEKQDIATKLDTYMQENIDLIDKLEKLSAEKVSSAESIEIVESLTQQEKLEIEAYQKKLDISSGNIKMSEENLVGENPELNDSVNQLTEETSELLQKIELFTEERREVMDKMEILSTENNQLSLKIKEIENNRDILVETYEHLQTEKEDLDNKLDEVEKQNQDLKGKIKELEEENQQFKVKYSTCESEKMSFETGENSDKVSQEITNRLTLEIDEYKALIDVQKQEITELKVQLLSSHDQSNLNVEMNEKLSELQEKYVTLLTENEKLKANVKVDSEKVFEKDAMESELNEAKHQLIQFEIKINDNLEEISNYKYLLETNKAELISSATHINELQTLLEEKNKELELHVEEITRMQELVLSLNNRLEEENDRYDETTRNLTVQLEALKSTMFEDMEQTQTYERQIDENCETITKLNTELITLNSKILDTEHMLESKDDEIKQLQNEKMHKDNIIKSLKDELREKDQNFNQVCDQLREKCLELQNKIEHDMSSMESSRGPLEDRIRELEIKNKEQLDKMKKIAGHLKKKNTAYQDLEQKYNEINEKWEVENKEKEIILNEKEKQLVDQDIKIKSLMEQLQDIEAELSNTQGSLTLKTEEYTLLSLDFEAFKNGQEANKEGLERRNSELQNELSQVSAQNEHLQNIIREYETRIHNLSSENEVLTSNANNASNIGLSEKDDVIRNLEEQIQELAASNETKCNALQAKIQELESYVETQDSEVSRYKERTSKLEEGLANVEERRMSLERRAIELGAELEEKSNDFEKVSYSEDILEQRLKYLIEQDEKIEKRLEETVVENQDLIEKINLLAKENEECKIILAEKTNEVSNNSATLAHLENENASLKKSVETLESKLQHLHQDYEKKLSDNKEYCDKMEIDLQEQLDHFNKERRSLLVQSEQLQDQITQYINTQEALRGEVAKYQEKLDLQQNDFEGNLNALRQLEVENNHNKNVIEQLNTELDITQSYAAEIIQLKQLLSYKDEEINNYKRQTSKPQNLQSFDQQSYHEKPNHSITDFFGTSKQDERLQTSSSTDFFSSVHQFDSAVQSNIQNTELSSLEMQVQQLQLQYNQTAAELQQANDKIKHNDQNSICLSEENKQLQEKLLHMEKQYSEIKISTISDETVSTQSQSVFTWPKQSNDPFQFINDPISRDQSVSVEEQPIKSVDYKVTDAVSMEKHEKMTLKELQDKIQTLEFMLFTVEKEKEEALLQCHQLHMELGRLVYEKENNKLSSEAAQNMYAASHDISSQIVVEADTEFTEKDRKQLQNVEFAAARPHQPFGEGDVTDYTNMVTVEEEAFQAKTAYLCYDDVDDKQTFKQQTHEVDSQVVSNSSTSYTSQDQKVLQQIEFTQLNPQIHQINQGSSLSIEKPCQAQTSYLCYEPVEGSPVHIDTFTDNDDGWGWGPEEAKLEQEHREKTENAPQNLKKQIENLEERIQILEMERENHLEIIKQSQIKSGKLIKKLKEFKIKNDQLATQAVRKTSVSDFGGLDDAIQDELKCQVNALELNIKEVKSDLDKEKREKENLLKRIDVLSSANERMIDMKEKQDIEILSWQQQNRQLHAKLNQMEWGDEFESTKQESKRDNVDTCDTNVQELLERINELNDTIKDLSLDNEELQALLEEQRNLRISAEKAKSIEPIPENVKTEAEYLSLLAEKNSLSSQIAQTLEENSQLKASLNSVVENEEKLKNQADILSTEKLQLEEKLEQNSISIDTLNSQVKELSQKLFELESNKKSVPLEVGLNPLELASKIDELNETVKLLSNDNENMQMMLEEQRNLRIAASKTDAFVENMRTEAEYMTLLSLKNELNDQVILLNAEKERIQADCTNAVAREKSIQDSIEKEVSERNNLQILLSEKEAKLEELSCQFDILKYEYNNMASNSSNAQKLFDEKNSYYEQLIAVQSENLQLKKQIEQNADIKQYYDTMVTEKNELIAETEEFRRQTDVSNVKVIELEEKLREAKELAHEATNLQDQLNLKTQELNDLIEKYNSKDSEFEMKLYSTIEQLNQEWSLKVDQRGSDIAESWKLHLESRESEFMHTEKQLRKEINEIEEKCNALVNENNELRKNVDAEIRNEVDRISALQQQIHDRQQYINELTRVAQEKQTEIDVLKNVINDNEVSSAKLNDLIQQKDIKISELENMITSMKAKTEELNLEIYEQRSKLEALEKKLQDSHQNDKTVVGELETKLNECKNNITKMEEDILSKKQALEQSSEYIESLQQQLEGYRTSYSVLEQQLNEKNLYINEITFKLQNTEVKKESEDKNYSVLQQQVQESQNQIQEYQKQVSSLNKQLQEAFTHVEIQNDELQSKEAQLQETKKMLTEKEQSYSWEIHNQVQEYNQALENQQQQVDELVGRKDMQLSMLETQHEEKNIELQELQRERDQLLQQLEMKNTEYDELQGKTMEHDALIDEENKQLSELREIIQEQVLKIETLKSELYAKSRDYDVLIAEIDIRKQSSPVVTLLKPETGEDKRKSTPIPEDDLAEPVSRAELDLALYMLHQRDVRCEELTVELMQLLEERDTLQLRLSNSIREKEEIRSRFSGSQLENRADATNVTESLSEAVARSGVSGIDLATGSSSSLPSPDEFKHESLATKISELKTLGYGKDKTLLDEQEFRRYQQYSIMQQHRDDASKLPPEAAARLVDASYTLSRDVQSPSKVLLNWLWGRSTPRVNDV